MTERIIETVEQNIARQTRPCRVHGAVKRETQWWTSGPHYPCPYCENTTMTLFALADALKAVLTDQRGVLLDGAYTLCSAIHFVRRVRP
jgi:hypothetical protein